MSKTIILLLAACSLAGCATAPQRTTLSAAQVVAVSPAPVVRQAPVRQVSTSNRAAASTTTAAVSSEPTTASLRPGATYVASFPEADRRAACVRLNYREGTPQFARCLEGDFPENPYFAQQ